jgi:hypothetical protein
MAILKIKQIKDDLYNDTSVELTQSITKSMAGAQSGTAAVATTAVAAGTAAYAGTSYTFSAAQLRGMFNYIAGSSCTNAHNLGTGIGTVGDNCSWGVTLFPVTCVINGKFGTAGSCAQLNPPGNEKAGETKRGTQAAATFVKYLISTGFGSSGTITAGPEAASSTAAKLPPVPVGHVAVGFIEYAAHATNPRKWYSADAGTFAPFTGGPAGATTSGTAYVEGAAVGVGVSGFTELQRMPYIE